MQVDVHKTLHPLYSTKKMPPFTATVKKMSFAGCNSKVYDHCHNPHITLSAEFQGRALLCKQALPASLTKPQIVTLFYLARLVSVILKQELQTFGNSLRNQN